ncbi:MAG TPA: tRNA preQ1(34) S-adenosylmethionine ribosyltransferase-isomerase QueA [Vicinamibacterales bacterium]|nr:tRNA preQ1(34) S-adenosylmethionine ribosyltransferase-isomerase QueA [Vicinamibacterales bacterium]
MRVAEFDFDLPSDLIAQMPPTERGASRLLGLSRPDGATAHRAFADLPTLLGPGDLLVVNDTRVFPARLIGRRLPGGGFSECLLIRPAEEPDTWVALVHPGQRLKPGSRMVFEREGVALEAEVLSRHFHGRRVVRLSTMGGGAVREAIHAVGHMPLPPYVKREDLPSDRDRYQTIFARAEGSIAAPTAGLHFTPALFDALDARGIERTAITLHVGYGTFQPVRAEEVEQHSVEPEYFGVTAPAAAALSRALGAGRRIVAVGTTTTRTLESLAVSEGGHVAPQSGETGLFIHPGHRFRIVSGLITNFHLPRSSLLMLVSAFAGREHVLAAYREAVAHRYRFYSYGDAMVIL